MGRMYLHIDGEVVDVTPTRNERHWIVDGLLCKSIELERELWRYQLEKKEYKVTELQKEIKEIDIIITKIKAI